MLVFEVVCVLSPLLCVLACFYILLSASQHAMISACTHRHTSEHKVRAHGNQIEQMHMLTTYCTHAQAPHADSHTRGASPGQVGWGEMYPCECCKEWENLGLTSSSSLYHSCLGLCLIFLPRSDDQINIKALNPLLLSLREKVKHPVYLPMNTAVYPMWRLLICSDFLLALC